MSESINQTVGEGNAGWQQISQRFLLTLAAGILGFALNACAVPVFGDLGRGTLIFGGIFYLLIAIAYGPVYGLIAALIASSRAVSSGIIPPRSRPSCWKRSSSAGWCSGGINHYSPHCFTGA